MARHSKSLNSSLTFEYTRPSTIIQKQDLATKVSLRIVELLAMSHIEELNCTQMTTLNLTHTEEDWHAFLTSCNITCAGLGWKGLSTYQVNDPGIVRFNDEENHLYILNWIALCFAGHPSTHAAVSLSVTNGHFTLHVLTKGGTSYLRDTAGDNEFVRMTQELLERQATPSTRTSTDMFQDRQLAERYIIRWCWPAFWGKVQALLNTLQLLDSKADGTHGRLDELIGKWEGYRKKSKLPFDQASIIDLMRSKLEAPKQHPTLSAEDFRNFIRDIRSKNEPATAQTAATLAKERHEIYFAVMKACLAIDRCDFIRASIDGDVVQDVKWRKQIGMATCVLMEDLFHQVQRLLEYHLGLITYLGHGLPYFRAAFAANSRDLKKVLSIHCIPLPSSPAKLRSVMLKESPSVWIPKVFNGNGIRSSTLTVTDEQLSDLVRTCENLWKAGDVIPLTTHTLCDMMYYLTHDGQSLDCEAIGTSDIPCLMCDRYISRLKNPRAPTKVDKLRYRCAMTAFDRTWTPPPHTPAQMDHLVSWALAELNVSVRTYLQKNGLRSTETNESVLKSFGLTNDDLDSM